MAAVVVRGVNAAIWGQRGLNGLVQCGPCARPVAVLEVQDCQLQPHGEGLGPGDKLGRGSARIDLPVQALPNLGQQHLPEHGPPIVGRVQANGPLHDCERAAVLMQWEGVCAAWPGLLLDQEQPLAQKPRPFTLRQLVPTVREAHVVLHCTRVPDDGQREGCCSERVLVCIVEALPEVMMDVTQRRRKGCRLPQVAQALSVVLLVEGYFAQLQGYVGSFRI
mmetsp:Transcript_141106/g.245952  ORF Transcript_141106/g.245952 Transcript_141106/m.245952 type:complete len:221 (-) Transcript_141106:357-1019(-)